MIVRRFVNNVIVHGELPHTKVCNKQVVDIIKEVNIKIKQAGKKKEIFSAQNTTKSA